MPKGFLSSTHRPVKISILLLYGEMENKNKKEVRTVQTAFSLAVNGKLKILTLIIPK